MKRNRIEIDTRLLNEILTADYETVKQKRIDKTTKFIDKWQADNQGKVNEYAPAMLESEKNANIDDLKAAAIEKHFKHHSGHCAKCYKPLNDLVLPLDTSVKSERRNKFTGFYDCKTTRLTACVLHTKELKGKVYTGKKCAACGVLFKSYGESNYCSLACRSHNAYHRLTKKNNNVMTCKNCDCEFTPKRTDSLFCGTKCRVIYWRMAKRQIDLFSV